jgi:hypothetical protein
VTLFKLSIRWSQKDMLRGAWNASPEADVFFVKLEQIVKTKPINTEDPSSESFFAEIHEVTQQYKKILLTIREI